MVRILVAPHLIEPEIVKVFRNTKKSATVVLSLLTYENSYQEFQFLTVIEAIKFFQLYFL